MALRRRLRGRKLRSYECLVSLRDGGAVPPLFLICWEGGRLVGYRDLIEQLPDDQPIYGLLSPRFDGRSPLFPEPTLEELARLFLEEVRRFRPEPPYLFAGYCFGGTLAHEMAAQLESEGETTAFLGLIESSPYGHGRFERRPGRIARDRAMFETLGYEGPTGVVSFVLMRLFGRFSWWRRRLRRLAYRTVLRTGWRWPGRLWTLEQVAIQTAMRSYVAPASNAHITLFEAHDPAHDLEPSVWVRLAAGGVETHPITATGIGHISMMREPYVGELADKLRERIRAAVSVGPEDLVPVEHV